MPSLECDYHSLSNCFFVLFCFLASGDEREREKRREKEKKKKQTKDMKRKKKKDRKTVSRVSHRSHGRFQGFQDPVKREKLCRADIYN